MHMWQHMGRYRWYLRREWVDHLMESLVLGFPLNAVQLLGAFHMGSSIARRFAPLQLESWGKLTQDVFNALFECVKAKFIIDMNDSEAYKCVHITMAKAYGEMRYELAEKIKSYPNFEVARRNCPNNISKDDWEFLVNLFSLEKFQEIDLFRDTHYSEKKEWINKEAEERYLNMVALRDEHSTEGSEPLSELEITQQVLGQRPRYL